MKSLLLFSDKLALKSIKLVFIALTASVDNVERLSKQRPNREGQNIKVAFIFSYFPLQKITQCIHHPNLHSIRSGR